MSSIDHLNDSKSSPHTPNVDSIRSNKRNLDQLENLTNNNLNLPTIQFTPSPPGHNNATTSTTSCLVGNHSTPSATVANPSLLFNPVTSAITPPNANDRLYSSPVRTNFNSNKDSHIFASPPDIQTRNTLDDYFEINDDTFHCQTPVRPMPSIPSTSTPKVHSPNVSLIRVSTMINAQQKIKNEGSRLMSSANRKKQKKTVSPLNAPLVFLRTSSIQKELVTTGSSRINTSNQYKKVYNFWMNNCRPCTYAPFKALKETLDESPYPLSLHHHRMLIEDFMMLNPNENITCLINKNHYFLSNKSKKWINLLADVMSQQPFQTILFQNQRFFAFNLTVKSNAYLNNLTNNNMTPDEITNICTKYFGAGLTCSFTNGKTELIKYHHFIDEYDTIQFWKVGALTRIAALGRSLEKLSDVSTLSPTFTHYLKEVYGDQAATILLLTKYDTIMKREDVKEQLNQLKKSSVSSNQLKDTFSLDDDDEPFIKFRDFVDQIAKDQIAKVYGQFAEFTTPIFTQNKLNEIINKFKIELPRYYEIIELILHKDVSYLLSKYLVSYAIIIYKFIQLLTLLNYKTEI
jgi:hypothetical protein